MKKLSAFLLALTLSLGVFGCSDDGPIASTEIITIMGTWELEKLIKENHEWDLAEWPNEYPQKMLIQGDSIMYDMSGTGKFWMYLHYDFVKTQDFLWKIENRMLIFTIDDEIDTIGLDFNYEKLTLTITNGDTMNLIYNRM